MPSRHELKELAAQAARENGIDPALFMGLVEQESGWDPNAVSPTGARGMTQVLRSTAADPGFGVTPLTGDIDDPLTNLRFGARYFRSMLNRYDGDVNKALAAYNGGAGNVDKGRYSKEMLGYMPGVQSKAQKYGYEGGGQAAPPSLQAAYTDTPGEVAEAFTPSGAMLGSGGSFYAPQAGLSQGTGVPKIDTTDSDLPDWVGPALTGFMAGGPVGALVAGGAAALMNRGGKDKRDPNNPDATTGSTGVNDAAAKAQADMEGLDYRGALGAAAKGALAGGLPGAVIAGGANLFGDWIGDRIAAKKAEKKEDKEDEATGNAGLGFSGANAEAGVAAGGSDLSPAAVSTSNYTGEAGLGSAVPGASSSSGGQDYMGNRPGLDWGDIGDAWRSITSGFGGGGGNANDVKSGYDEGSVV